MFSVPRVGAHVWVFFEGGDITRPVYFAYSYGQSEWSSIQVQNQENPDIHSPSVGLKENDPASSHVHTGKTVWNEKGGVIEFINTDDFESVKIADYHGSHITMDKLGITESTAPNKGKKLEVNGDYYVDVRGNYILRIQGERQTIMQGYDHVVHGNLADVDLQTAWLSAAAPVMKNAAQRATTPNFQPQQQAIHESSVKKAPNNDFEMDVSLDFKVPPGKTIAQLNDTVKGVMKSAAGATNLAVKSMTDIVSNTLGTVNKIISGVKGLLSGLTGLLTGVMGRASKLISDKMTLSTAQLGDPLRTLGISLKVSTIPAMPAIPEVVSKVITPVSQASTASANPSIPFGGTPPAASSGGNDSALKEGEGPPWQYDARTQQIIRQHGFSDPSSIKPSLAKKLVDLYNRVDMPGKGGFKDGNGAPLEGPGPDGHIYKNGYQIS